MITTGNTNTYNFKYSAKATAQSPARRYFSSLSLNVFHWIPVILLLIFSPTHSQADPALHSQAITLVRSGKYNEAISLLEVLHQKDPENKQVTNDLIVSYSWGGQYGRAYALFNEHNSDFYPRYVQTAMLSACRNLQQFDQALELAEKILKESPQAIDILLYKGLLSVDKREIQSARDVLETLLKTTGKSVEYYRLSVYIHTVEQNWLAGLADYHELNKLLSADHPLLREQCLSLQYLRAVEAGKPIITEHEQFFSDHDQATFLINQAAERLRWNDSAARNFNEIKMLSMQALAKQINAWELLEDIPDNEQQIRLLLYDLMITLRYLRQMDDVEALHQLLTEKNEVPDYVKHAAAGAMLANRHPDKSHEIYKQILKYNPHDYQAQIGLFYSYIEEEDFDSAYDFIDDLFKNEPVFQSFSDKKYRLPNEKYLNFGVLAILARFYGDQLEEAWTKIDDLVRNAPANHWLFEIRAQVSNAREWYRQALYDYHYALLLEPTSLAAEVSEVSSLIALRRYGQARPILQDIQEHFPDEHSTKVLTKDWKFSRKPQYLADITFSNSSGPDLDGNGVVATAELLSSPISDTLYINALHRYAWNEIREGEETYHRYALGLNYHLIDWEFLGHVTYNTSNLDEVGGMAMVSWDPDDFWRFSLKGERFSVSTPLRALYHKIRSDALTVTTNYRWSEQRFLSLNVQGSTFTDDNKRLAGTAVLNQRLIDIPHIDLDGRIEAYASTNSIRNTPYYNPERDFSLQGALHLDHVYYRYYDKLLAQQIDVGYGFYEQKGFGTDWIGHIRYEQRYKFTPWVEMLAGIEIGRNVYDGEAEPYRLVRFMITGRF
ncbi:MAG TPA: poly-beta-1,6 N-acetyl-D-glucosamine export porin PgaA [Desulfocapsa sulfexigens]|nr:poly-beta-1,6 N-acetyl-D-glucosamine export porin PgaA [Desulfocapsa sulfexigens]